MAKLNFYDIDAVKAFVLNILIENAELKSDLDYEKKCSNDWFDRYKKADQQVKDLEVSWSSIIVTLGSINLRCKSLLKRSKIVIIGVRSQVVVPNKDIATHGMIQLIVRAELMLINQFLLEGMIESLYRSIIIRTAGFTHTLRNPT